VLIGLLGNAAHFPPLVVYVSRWFDRRRGAAVALISSGQYLAGMVWPTVFERGLTQFGWQATMLGYAAVVAITIVPLALFLSPPPQPGCWMPGSNTSSRHAVSPSSRSPVSTRPPASIRRTRWPS
jgi:MFS family permease